MTKSFLRVYWLTCVFTMIAAAASATMIVLPTDEQLILKSPVIVTATVSQSNPVQIGNKIWTESTLTVDHTYKGGVSGQIIVRELGGQIGDNITKVFGAPEYTPGERVLAFLTPTPRGDFQTIDLFAGKFSEERTLAGGRVWLRDEARADVALVDRQFKPIASANVQREASGFEQFVSDRVAGRDGIKSYAIENPLLQRDFDKTSGRIQANFTLISEPTVYRWFAFDRGQSVPWYSYGTQPGYNGGGVSEVQTAMSSWTGYSAALIRYTYAGAGSGAPANSNTNNNINEIEFNDPNQEISGSWNPSGGVVGLGGFNGVGSRQSWTSTFAADSSHTQATFSAWEITEAFFTVQDGVSPTAGVPSQTLAEICAHELGHTLGLGHSTDNTALMYPSVTGLGPSLRADDQLAARWLYPNGSGTPTPPPPSATIPNAPSNLSATVSGSTINLLWRDNATNETGQYIYVAAGNGAFTRIGDAGASATTSTLTGASAGSYRIYVTAYNSAGESSASNTATVTVSSTSPPQPTSAPVAAFAVSPNNGVAGSTTFIFTDQSTGSITTHSWSFGDGATSTLTNAAHVYANAGNYTIVLTVSGSGGSSQATRTVSVANPAPSIPSVSAAFDFSPASPNVGDAVAFTDRSSGSPSAWSWSFGDGTSSTLQNPVHAYSGPGTYTINVTVFNQGSSSVASRQITVNAFAPYHSLVSASAQTSGANGSAWRTELTLFNSGNEAATGQYVFVPGDGGTSVTMPLYIAPKQSITFQNALQDIFGMAAGAGAIAIDASSAASTPSLKVESRTYTGALTGGTYGQAVPGVSPANLQPTLYLTGIESDTSYRTNIGLVNRTGTPASTQLTLYDSNGSIVSAANVAVAPNNFQQSPLTSYFPSIAGVPYTALSMRVDASIANAVSVYASVVDNKTQDPVYVQAS
ncbi:MAG TPA: PKD domain-containing protein, partial [Thermoanaerobaculia bacterium]|nr:PKD domain-containing protein [Thermoanaerobaculia bacterium]